MAATDGPLVGAGEAEGRPTLSSARTAPEETLWPMRASKPLKAATLKVVWDPACSTAFTASFIFVITSSVVIVFVITITSLSNGLSTENRYHITRGQLSDVFM